jgi:hypothetical protein
LLEGFLQSSGFIDGGVTGVSMLLANTTGVLPSLWLPVINLPFGRCVSPAGPGVAVRSVLRSGCSRL